MADFEMADFEMAGFEMSAIDPFQRRTTAAVMAGRKREARLRAEGPAIHVLLIKIKTWMPGIKPGMTSSNANADINRGILSQNFL
jgi:hypothetical protein